METNKTLTDTRIANIAQEQMVEIEEGRMLRGIKREYKAGFWWQRRVAGCLGDTAKGSEGHSKKYSVQ